MNTSEILSHVDHTLLKAFATWEDIQKLCEEAMELSLIHIFAKQRTRNERSL